MKLEELLQGASAPTRALRGRGWVTPALSALLTKRTALVWWWSRAPKGGATTPPPELPQGLFDGVERCHRSWRWHVRGDELWALTVVTARLNAPLKGSKTSPRAPLKLESARQALTLITTCELCSGSTQRRPFGSPLELPDEALVHINTLAPLSAHERWLSTQLRSPERPLSALRSQTCLCR